MRRAILTVFATVVVLLGVPVAAHAQSDPIAGAVAGLKGHTVYVAPDSGQDVTTAEVQSLEAQIAKGRAAIFIAVLPEAAASQAGGVDGLPHTLAIAMGDPTAVFGVVSGHSFRAGAKAGAGLNSGEAGTFASAAVKAHSPASNRLIAALSDFVTRVDNRVGTAKPASGTAAASSKGSDAGKIVLIIVLLLLALTIIGIAAYYIVKKRRQEAELARRRSVLKRRLEDLSGDVVNLEATVAINDNAKAAYSNGVTAYTSANSRFSDTASELELDDVEHYVEIAESAMSDAKEYAAGRDPHPVQPVSVSRVATLRPKQTYAKEDAPKAAPTQTTTVVNNYNGGGNRWQGNYNGYGYGYYPGYGWGYYGNDGGFVAGMLAAEMMEDREDRYEDRQDREDEPSYSSSSSSSSSSSDSGSGDWGSSSSSPSYDPPSTDFGGGGDWGGSGGGDSGGGGGGDW